MQKEEKGALQLDFLVSEEIFLVMLADLSHHAAGIAYCNHVCGDVTGYHAACADDGVVADGDTGKHDCACAYLCDLQRTTVLRWY